MPVLSAAAASAALINNLLSLDGGRAKAEYCPLSMDSTTVTCSAGAGTGHSEAAADDIDQLLHLVEMERQMQDQRQLARLFTEVTTQCSKTLEVEGVAGEVELPRPVMADMISNIVTLSRTEPCGVRGAAIVVLFGSSPAYSSSSSSVNVGKFAVDPDTVPTFEIWLTLKPCINLGSKIINLIRKIQGRKSLVKVDPSYSISKKKLYRSDGGL